MRGDWLESGGLKRIDVAEYPLEVETGGGNEFLYHPLLRGGFLEDVYECFTDQEIAELFMQRHCRRGVEFCSPFRPALCHVWLDVERFFVINRMNPSQQNDMSTGLDIQEYF